MGINILIVELAGPKIGTEVREVKQRGVDMLIALDVSASMNAEDVRPSRLEKAKFEINRLIERIDGDRVGLIVFTGEAFLQSPMTLDYSALRLFLDIVSTDQMPTSATDFASALEVAEQAFNALDSEEQENPISSTATRVLLIISDGEDHEQEYEDALNTLTDAQVSIYTLGIGTTAGTTIPLYEAGTGELVGYKRDRQGKVVTTALQREALQQIAAQGGEATIKLIAEILSSMPLSPGSMNWKKVSFPLRSMLISKTNINGWLLLGSCCYCLHGLYPLTRLKSIP